MSNNLNNTKALGEQISNISTEIQNVKNLIRTLDIKIDQLNSNLSKIIWLIPLTSGGFKEFQKEYEEIAKISKKLNITFEETVTDLESKGLLPVYMTQIRKIQKDMDESL